MEEGNKKEMAEEKTIAETAPPKAESPDAMPPKKEEKDAGATLYDARMETEEKSQEADLQPIRDFKSKYLPRLVAILGCVAAVLYLLWVFGVFG